MDTQSVRSDGEMTVGLTWLEIEAVSLGLRTLIMTQPSDDALCRAATAGLAKLPGAAPSFVRGVRPATV